jgi:hypothetical protein
LAIFNHEELETMNKMAVPFYWLCVCAALGGCGGKEYEGDRRFPLSGKVTVDGQPMQMGVISFLPQADGGRVSGGPIKDGTYSVPEAKGATAGKYRVEIHWNKLTGKKIPNPFDKTELIDEMMEGLPAKYHQDSELTADVSSTQTTFDFDLKTE